MTSTTNPPGPDTTKEITTSEPLSQLEPGAAPFDERSPGLDHVSFSSSDRAELEKWASRLDELGIVHGEIVDAPYGSGLSFRDPDGIALEFFAPPS